MRGHYWQGTAHKTDNYIVGVWSHYVSIMSMLKEQAPHLKHSFHARQGALSPAHVAHRPPKRTLRGVRIPAPTSPGPSTATHVAELV